MKKHLCFLLLLLVTGLSFADGGNKKLYVKFVNSRIDTYEIEQKKASAIVESAFAGIQDYLAESGYELIDYTKLSFDERIADGAPLTDRDSCYPFFSFNPRLSVIHNELVVSVTIDLSKNPQFAMSDSSRSLSCKLDRLTSASETEKLIVEFAKGCIAHFLAPNTASENFAQEIPELLDEWDMKDDYLMSRIAVRDDYSFVFSTSKYVADFSALE